MSDREFLKLFSGLIGALVALTIVLLIIANAIGARSVATEPNTAEVAERIKPIGQLAIGQAPSAPSGGGIIATANAATGDSGQSVYDQSCAACHAMGVAGAPKLGDKAAWKDRLAQGMPVLYEHAIKGYQGKTGFMPPKGGNASLSDDVVKAAVDYMVSKVK